MLWGWGSFGSDTGLGAVVVLSRYGATSVVEHDSPDCAVFFLLVVFIYLEHCCFLFIYLNLRFYVFPLVGWYLGWGNVGLVNCYLYVLSYFFEAGLPGNFVPFGVALGKFHCPISSIERYF